MVSAWSGCRVVCVNMSLFKFRAVSAEAITVERPLFHLFFQEIRLSVRYRHGTLLDEVPAQKSPFVVEHHATRLPTRDVSPRRALSGMLETALLIVLCDRLQLMLRLVAAPARGARGWTRPPGPFRRSVQPRWVLEQGGIAGQTMDVNQ